MQISFIASSAINYSLLFFTMCLAYFILLYGIIISVYSMLRVQYLISFSAFDLYTSSWDDVYVDWQ